MSQTLCMQSCMLDSRGGQDSEGKKVSYVKKKKLSVHIQKYEASFICN